MKMSAEKAVHIFKVQTYFIYFIIRQEGHHQCFVMYHVRMWKVRSIIRASKSEFYVQFGDNRSNQLY